VKPLESKCVFGIPEIAINNAMEFWDSRHGDGGKMMSASFSYIDMVPKYPQPGTPEFTRCISKWYNAMSQARQMDEWLRQIGQLQGYLNAGQPILDALVVAYQDCMGGAPA